MAEPLGGVLSAAQLPRGCQSSGSAAAGAATFRARAYDVVVFELVIDRPNGQTVQAWRLGPA
jgi:hypothetical protein